MFTVGNSAKLAVASAATAASSGPRELARDHHVELLQHLRAQEHVAGPGVRLKQGACLFALAGRIGVKQVHEDVGVEEILHRR